MRPCRLEAIHRGHIDYSAPPLTDSQVPGQSQLILWARQVLMGRNVESSHSWSTIIASSSFWHLQTPKRSTSAICVHSVSGISWVLCPLPPIPALLTAMSSRPNFFQTSSRASLTCPDCRTSSCSSKSLMSGYCVRRISLAFLRPCVSISASARRETP